MYNKIIEHSLSILCWVPFTNLLQPLVQQLQQVPDLLLGVRVDGEGLRTPHLVECRPLVIIKANIDRSGPNYVDN